MNSTITRKKKSNLHNIENICLLSPLQLDNLKRYTQAKGEGLFHENLLFNFDGKVDIELFNQSWEKIIERHSILRTSIFQNNLNTPIQVVMKNADLPLEVFQWQDKSPDEQKVELEKLMDKDRQTDYVLEKAPLMRLAIIIRNDNSFSLWWRFHHMIMDGWAFTVVLWDFLAIYKSLFKKTGEPDILPGYDYSEYITFLKTRDKSKEEEHWKKYLKGFVPQKELIKLKPPKAGTVKTPVRQGRIDKEIYELFQPIQKVIKANEITMNAVFQGIYFLLLSYYSGGELDMVTGSTAADRSLALENSHARVGLFVNTIPIRYKIKKNIKFVEWAKELQKSMMETFQYTSSSEEEIKNWCGLKTDETIFHSALIFKNIPLADDPFEGLEFKLNNYDLESRPHYPLSVFVWPDENLELKIVYDNKRYTEDDANQILTNITKALTRLISNPAIMVEELMKF